MPNKTVAAPRVAGYARVSTGKQAKEGLSLEQQERVIRERAAREGWGLVDIYVERGLSGKKDERPELLRLFSRLDSLDHLIIPRLDRLGRRTVTLQENFERLERAGVGLVCLKPEFDSSTPTGRMVRDILAALASYESEVTGERVDAVMGGRIEKGKHHGKAPYGYLKAEKKLISDPDTAPIVQRIFRELAEGVGTKAIAKKLNSEKVPRPDKGIWRTSTVSKISNNTTYNGFNSYGEQVARGEHEPIIDDELWRKVQALRSANKQNPAGGRGRRPKRHLFGKGLLRCGVCGGSMSPTTAGNRYETYRCVTKSEGGPCTMSNVPRKIVDKAVFGYFETVGVDIDATRRQLEGVAAAKLGETRTRLRAAKQAEIDSAAAVARVKADYVSGAITAADWKELRGDLEAAHAVATADRKALEVLIADIESAHSNIDGAKAAAGKLAAIRSAVAGEADSESGLDAVRAALTRAFESFWIGPSRAELSATDRAVISAQAAEHDDDAAQEFSGLPVGRWTIQPIPRLEIVELVEAIDADSEPMVEIRPVLKAESLNAPVSVVADVVQFLDRPGGGANENDGGETLGDGEGRELAGVGADELEVTF